MSVACTFDVRHELPDWRRPDPRRGDFAPGLLQPLLARTDRVREPGAGRYLRARRYALARHGQSRASAERVRPPRAGRSAERPARRRVWRRSPGERRRICSSTRTSSCTCSSTQYDEDFYGLIDERAATAPVGFYRKFRQDVERRLQMLARQARGRSRRAASLRRLLPDPARVPLHLPQHHRRLRADRAPARHGVAVDLHARHAALPPLALPAHGRRHHADLGALGHRQGAGGPGDRPVALHSVRREKHAFVEDFARILLTRSISPRCRRP